MNESHSVDQRYRNLLERAEVFFRKLVKGADHSAYFGARRWIDDLEATRRRELVEEYQLGQGLRELEENEELDVPSD
jgi:hypothetical protein